jgi:hypothetical protein
VATHTHGRRGSASSNDGDPRPMAGYGVLMALYSAGTGMVALRLKGKKRKVERLSLMDLALLGLATEHLSRLITKDSITSPVRAPFTEFKEPAGEGEVNEEVVGTGLRHAIGELLTCPFCVAQWVATTLIAGTLAAPQITQAAVSVCAVARTSDYLQLSYGILRERQ